MCEVFGGEEGFVHTCALGNLVDGERLVETFFKLETDGCQCAFERVLCNQRNGLVGGNEVVVLAFGRYREGGFDVSRLCVTGRVERLGYGYGGDVVFGGEFEEAGVGGYELVGYRVGNVVAVEQVFVRREDAVVIAQNERIAERFGIFYDEFLARDVALGVGIDTLDFLFFGGQGEEVRREVGHHRIRLGASHKEARRPGCGAVGQ